MTLDPNARQVKQRVSVAPSPATSGKDWAVDAADTYFLHSLEQTVPFKVTVYPQNEMPTKLNSETILINAYALGTRTGVITIREVAAGSTARGSVSVTSPQPGDTSIPQNEVQALTLDATAGTYTLSFGGNTTASINWNANAATIQARLEALATIGAGNVTVSGTGPFTITFAGALASAQQQLITADATNLTTGGAGSATVTEITHGDGSHNEVQQITVTADSGVFTLSWGGYTTNPLPENANAAAVATELQALTSIGAGNVAVTGQAGGPYTVTFQGVLGLAARALITVDATRLTSGGVSEIQTLVIDGSGGTFKLSADGGVNKTTALAYNASAATVQAALEALAAIGVGNCVVTLDASAGVYTVYFCGAKANQPVALLTADVTSLTTDTMHITDCVRAQDGTNARAIVVGDYVEVAQSSQGSVDAIGTLVTAGKIVITPGASEMQAGATLKLDTVLVADPSSAPSVQPEATDGGFTFLADPSNDYWRFGYTWIDGSGHETKMSPTKLVNAGLWDAPAPTTGSFLITLPPIPTGATGFRIYAIHSSSGTLKRQAATTYISSESVSPTTMTAYNSGGAAPPGSNNFGSTSPAQIIAGDGTTVILSADQTHFSATNPVVEGTASPGVATTFARSDHVHPAAPGVTTYKKNTTKTVVSSVADVDLLNSEITVPANTLGANGVLEGSAFGDYLQNQGAVQNGYRFKLKLGGTTIIDSGAPATALPNSTVRYSWQARWSIMNQGATNAQYVQFWLEMTMALAAASTFQSLLATTGIGRTSARIAQGASNNLAIAYLINNTAAVDTTASCALVLSVILPASSATVDCVLQGAVAKVF